MKTCKEEWYDIVIKQENILQVDYFTRENALDLGLLIYKNAKQKYSENIAVQIMMEGTTVFSIAMGETGEPSYMWMKCKYNTFLKTRQSSMRALVERVLGKREKET